MFSIVFNVVLSLLMRKKIKYILKFCLCVWLYVYGCRCHKRASDPVVLEWQAGTWTHSPKRAVSTLNHWAISPANFLSFSKRFWNSLRPKKQAKLNQRQKSKKASFPSFAPWYQFLFHYFCPSLIQPRSEKCSWLFHSRKQTSVCLPFVLVVFARNGLSQSLATLFPTLGEAGFLPNWFLFPHVLYAYLTVGLHLHPVNNVETSLDRFSSL